MSRRAADLRLIRRTVGLWTILRWTLHSWVAMTCLVQLCTEGMYRLVLTLPVVIIALLDAWNEFRAAPHMPDNSNSSLNCGEQSNDDGWLGAVSRFPL